MFGCACDAGRPASRSTSWFAASEIAREPRLGAFRSARRAAEQELRARVGDRDGGNRRYEPHPAELGGTERAAPHAIVEVDDPERLAVGDERHREHAAQLEGVHAAVHLRKVARGVDGDDRLAEVERALGERAAELELLSGEIGVSEIARRARLELFARRAQEEQPALDARPQHERVHHLLQQGAQPIAAAERAHERLDVADLFGR